MGQKSTRELKSEPSDGQDNDQTTKPKYAFNCLIIGDLTGKQEVIDVGSDVLANEERVELKNLYLSELCNSFQKIIEISQNQNVQINCNLAEVAKIIANPQSVSPSELSFYVKSLWNDAGIQKIIENGFAQQLPASADFFINRIEEFYNDAPASNLELFMMNKFNFKVGKYTWKLVKHLSDQNLTPALCSSLAAVIYILNIDEWNLPSPSNPAKTKLKEKIKEWKNYVNHPSLNGLAFIVVLNNVDLFHQNFDPVQFKEQFKNYGTNANAAIQHIKDIVFNMRKVPADEQNLQNDPNWRPVPNPQFIELNSAAPLNIKQLFDLVTEYVFAKSACHAGTF